MPPATTDPSTPPREPAAAEVPGGVPPAGVGASALLFVLAAGAFVAVVGVFAVPWGLVGAVDLVLAPAVVGASVLAAAVALVLPGDVAAGAFLAS